ncbi:MAG TPA: nitrate- and nitrite sensing domain-containing protein, partial [Catenuloplanes sp.]
MNSRTWSIRSKIVALVAVPLTALLALWIFATALTAAPALNLLSARTVLDQVSRPGENLVTELQRERRLSLIYLARDGDGAALAGQRVRTEEAAKAFEGQATSAAVRSAASGVLIGRISELVTSLRTLPSGRGLIDRRAMDNSGALALFSGVVDTAFRMFGATVTQEDPELERQTRALTGLGRAREMLGQSDALLAGALTTGRFGAGEHAQFVQIVGVQRYLYADAVAELSDADRAAYQRLADGPAFVGLRQMQDRVVTAGRSGEPPPVDAAQWQSAYESAVQQLRDFDAGTAQALADRAAPVAMRILVRLGVAGVLGLTALLVAIVVSVRVGRSLVRRLGGLRGAALQLTKQRLPEVVARLRRGEDVDVAAETPALEYGTDEIGQLGHAFTEVQRTAVQSAVDEAALRRGLNEIFLNIARRSQTLLHRQLALLDRMERRTERPDELEDLFRVDHLATRMRRHAEDLVILAGATPGRGWRNPVPFVDVIRGAVSEVEDYRRIDVTAVAGAACAGRAVGDVIHLLAELLENATSYSPPHTRVLVAGQLVPNGFAVEIEDRGLGMTPEALDDANRRLAEPPEFDPTNSARLGLFVVSRLSVRHGVRVRLRPSPYGGVTAVALIPAGLVVTTGSGPGEPLVDAYAGDPSDPSLLGPSPTAPGTLPTRTTGPVGVDGPRPVRFPATLPADPGRQRRTDPPLRSVPPLRP